MLDLNLKPLAGTYALVLKSESVGMVQIGQWGVLNLNRAHYIYVGSAFGPGGVKARVQRHYRASKSKHWHIDYLREVTEPVGVAYCHDSERLEHKWAQLIADAAKFFMIKGFGCTDCRCDSHLFVAPENMGFV